MLYETLSQPLVILYIFLIGVASGLLFDLVNLLLCFCNKNKILKQILTFIAVVCSAIILYFTNLTVNFGRFRIYIIFIYLISFALERFIIGNFWTKWINSCYTRSKRKQSGEKEVLSNNVNSGSNTCRRFWRRHNNNTK